MHPDLGGPGGALANAGYFIALTHIVSRCPAMCKDTPNNDQLSEPSTESDQAHRPEL
jgi:hypothetical protein